MKRGSMNCSKQLEGLTCDYEADYVYRGRSLCQEHFKELLDEEN